MVLLVVASALVEEVTVTVRWNVWSSLTSCRLGARRNRSRSLVVPSIRVVVDWYDFEKPTSTNQSSGAPCASVITMSLPPDTLIPRSIISTLVDSPGPRVISSGWAGANSMTML